MPSKESARRRVLVSLFLQDHYLLKMLSKEQFHCNEHYIRSYLGTLSDPELETLYCSQVVWLSTWLPPLGTTH